MELLLVEEGVLVTVTVFCVVVLLLERVAVVVLCWVEGVLLLERVTVVAFCWVEGVLLVERLTVADLLLELLDERVAVVDLLELLELLDEVLLDGDDVDLLVVVLVELPPRLLV